MDPQYWSLTKQNHVHPKEKTKQTVKGFIANIFYPYNIMKLAELLHEGLFILHDR